MPLTTDSARIRTPHPSILAALMIVVSATQAWPSDVLTPGESLHAGRNAMEAKQNNKAIDLFYHYLDLVDASDLPRVITIFQDIRIKLATLLTEENRHEEAVNVLCDYLNGRYVAMPRHAMKMLATGYYETESWRKCVDIATCALEYNQNPWPIPKKRPDEEKDPNAPSPTEKEYTPAEISELKKIRDNALPKAPENDTQSKAAEPKHAFSIAPTASEGQLDLFGEILRDAEQKKSSINNTLVDKTVGIYFAASGHSSSQFFTAKLVKFHTEMTEADKPFEIIFVSADRDANSMYEFMRKTKMPWLALPYDSGKKKELAEKFGVKSIPFLAIVDPSGKLITLDGKKDVERRGKKAFEFWTTNP